MTFTTPLGLLALLALPAVVALHLFRNRLPERRVAALFLFAEQALIAGAGRTRTRLLRTASLWLELLAALLLALWLGGLSFGGSEAQHVVVVLDDSASMQAGGHARAQQELRTRLGRLGSGDFVSVLRTGERPEVLAGPRARAADAEAALVRWRPLRSKHAMGPALDLARELALGGGQVWFVSDEEPPPGSDDVTWLGFGNPAPNAAILTAIREASATGGEQVRARLVAFGAIARLEVRLFAGAQEVARGEVVFVEGLADVVLPVPAGCDVVRLVLPADVLAVDDEALLLPPLRRVVGIGDQWPDDLRQAFGSERLLAALPDVRREPDSQNAQLLLRTAPGTLLPGQCELVVVAGDGERQALAGPFVVDRAHPWTSGLLLQGLAWVAVRGELPGRVLVAAGPLPLLTDEDVAGVDGAHRAWLAVDPRLGNFVRAPDWPVLAANLVDACRQSVPGPIEAQVPLGGEARFRRAAAAGGDRGDARSAFPPLFVIAPDGSRTPGHGERTVGFVLQQPGVHTVVDADERPLGRFAARFVDAAESDLRLLRSGERAAVPSAGDVRRGAARDTGSERRVLALLLLLVLLADWWVLARRDA